MEVSKEGTETRITAVLPKSILSREAMVNKAGTSNREATLSKEDISNKEDTEVLREDTANKEGLIKALDSMEGRISTRERESVIMVDIIERNTR